MGIELNETTGICNSKITKGSFRAIVEVAQQLAWIGAALRVSDGRGIQYSQTKIIQSRGTRSNGAFEIQFRRRPLSKQEKSCWYPLFSNPVIARKFPVPERRNNEIGLEIPLEIMAALCGVRHAMEYDGGLLIKGFSAMLIPMKQYSDSVQWHLVRRDNGARLPYRMLCGDRVLLDNTDCQSIMSARAFLSWWPSAESNAGTCNPNYKDIDWSEAKEVGKSAKVSGGSFGFQYIVTGQLDVALGAKDGTFRVSCKDAVETIVQCAEKTPVVLYDYEERRGWLVSALSVMLHVLRTRHLQVPYNNDSHKVYEDRQNSGTTSTQASTIQYLKDIIFQNKSSNVSKHESSGRPGVCFKEEIVDIWSLMERLMEKDDIMKAAPGLEVRGTMQSSLRGWEFMALVEQRNFRRKQQTLFKTNGGWTNLVNDIDSVVLFGTGFGEIIKPNSRLQDLCPRWRCLPKGKDFLGVGCPMLENLFAEAGSRKTRKYLTSTHLQWHCGSMLFEPCISRPWESCACDRVQQIFYDSSTTIGQVQPPRDLAENGCVIFGRGHHGLRPRKQFTSRKDAIHAISNTPLQTLNVANSGSSSKGPLRSMDPSDSPSPPNDEVRTAPSRSIDIYADFDTRTGEAKRIGCEAIEGTSSDPCRSDLTISPRSEKRPRANEGNEHSDQQDITSDRGKRQRQRERSVNDTSVHQSLQSPGNDPYGKSLKVAFRGPKKYPFQGAMNTFRRTGRSEHRDQTRTSC